MFTSKIVSNLDLCCAKNQGHSHKKNIFSIEIHRPIESHFVYNLFLLKKFMPTIFTHDKVTFTHTHTRKSIRSCVCVCECDFIMSKNCWIQLLSSITKLILVRFF